MKKNLVLMISACLLILLVGCKTEEESTNISPVTKVTIIDPVGYAQNMGAWIPATGGTHKILLLEEGQHYVLGIIWEPSSVQSPVVTWRAINSTFEEATINAQGIISGVKEDPDNSNECLIIVEAAPTVSDTIEVKVLKELSGVYEIKADNRDIVIPDGGSIRSTVRVTSASNASGSLNNKDLITGFFSDKNRANFNDAVTITFIAGSSFDIQANGPGVNILMAYSKAYISSPVSGEVKYFDDVRDYAVLASTCRRQALQVDSAYVSLDQHNLHLAKGATAQLTAKLVAGNPRKSATITFVSSNPDVATVDQTGKVTAVGAGLATITASTNHLAEEQECVVNVDEAVPVAVTRIADQPDFTTTHTVTRSLIVEGQNRQLYSDSHKDEVNAASGTIWHSTDPTVVTVDNNGLATAVGRGSAVIYATPYIDMNGTQVQGISDCSCFTVMPDYTKAKLGDIFYSDGSFSTNVEAGKTPIGIIVYLNCDASSNPIAGSSALTESAELSQYGAIGTEKNFHGLVMSLKNAATNVKWGKEAASTQLVGVTVAKDDATMKYSSTVLNSSGFNAAIYTNGEDIITGAPTFNPAESYPACYAGWHYNVNVPSFVTNWFMPTSPQWYAVLFNGLGGLQAEGITPAWNTYYNNANAFKKINDALGKLSAVGVDKLPENALIWTANEGDDNGTTAAALLVNGNGLKFMPVSKTVNKGENNEESLVRTFFAF